MARHEAYRAKNHEYATKGPNLDLLQEEVEKLMALLKDRQTGTMSWNMFLQERLEKLHTLLSKVLNK